MLSIGGKHYPLQKKKKSDSVWPLKVKVTVSKILYLEILYPEILYPENASQKSFATHVTDWRA